jgi:hypothetical protein
MNNIHYLCYAKAKTSKKREVYSTLRAIFFIYEKKILQRYKKNSILPNKVIHIGKKNVNNFFKINLVY